MESELSSPFLTNYEPIKKTFLGPFFTEGISPSKSISLNYVISGMYLLVRPGKKPENTNSLPDTMEPSPPKCYSTGSALLPKRGQSR
jgi:hypothetical protein